MDTRLRQMKLSVTGVCGYLCSLLQDLVQSCVCVCRVFIFKDTWVLPHLSVGLISVRQKGGLPGPPPVIPLPESLVTVCL